MDLNNSEYDVLIAGGGPVGATLAIALASLPLRVGLVDGALPPYLPRHCEGSAATRSNPEGSGTVPEPMDCFVASAPRNDGKGNYDTRTIALTYVSKKIYEALGIWPDLAISATPIQHIHVSEKGGFGKTRFRAADVKLPALGYTLKMENLQSILRQRIQQTQVGIIAPATITDLATISRGMKLTIQADGNNHEVHTKLLVAADGADSFIRKQLQIPTWQHDYQQSALVTTIQLQESHRNTAYERFTKTGPMALLPLSEQHTGLVWVGEPALVKELQNLPDNIFLARLQRSFGYRAGRFLRVGARQIFPLRLVSAKEQVKARVVMLGNASHSLHPIAAQGFNLSLRDVAALVQILENNLEQLNSDKDFTLLQDYESWRRNDKRETIYGTDSLVRLFNTSFAPIALGRNLGMLALNLCTPTKRFFMQRAMGFTPNMSHLAVGSC